MATTIKSIQLKAYSDIDHVCSGTARTRKFFQTASGNTRISWSRGWARLRIKTPAGVRQTFLKEVKPFEYVGLLFGHKVVFTMKQVNGYLQVWPAEPKKEYKKAQPLHTPYKKKADEQPQLPFTEDLAQDLLS